MFLYNLFTIKDVGGGPKVIWHGKKSMNKFLIVSLPGDKIEQENGGRIFAIIFGAFMDTLLCIVMELHWEGSRGGGGVSLACSLLSS